MNSRPRGRGRPLRDRPTKQGSALQVVEAGRWIGAFSDAVPRRSRDRSVHTTLEGSSVRAGERRDTMRAQGSERTEE